MNKERTLRILIDSMMIVLFLSLLAMPISFVGMARYSGPGVGEVLGETKEVAPQVTTPTYDGRVLTPAPEKGYEVIEQRMMELERLEELESSVSSGPVEAEELELDLELELETEL